MLLLTSVNDSVFVYATGTVDLECHVAFVDKDQGITPGRQNTLITASGNTSICSSPPENVQRNVRTIDIKNNAAVTETVCIKHTDGVTPIVIWQGQVASSGSVSMGLDKRWHVYTPSGTVNAGISIQDVVLEGEDKIFSYNASGQLTSISGTSKQIAITYTSSGDISAITKTYDGTSTTTTLSYNLEGNIDAVTITQ